MAGARIPMRSNALFLACDRGATAVEFALIGPILVLMLLGCMQFSLVFLSQMQIKMALADVASTALNPTSTSSRDPAAIRTAICSNLMMAENCTANLKLEQRPASDLSGGYRTITGATFDAGAANQVLVIRAKAPIYTFVPGVEKFSVSATSIWLKK